MLKRIHADAVPAIGTVEQSLRIAPVSMRALTPAAAAQPLPDGIPHGFGPLGVATRQDAEGLGRSAVESLLPFAFVTFSAGLDAGRNATLVQFGFHMPYASSRWVPR